MEEYAKTNTQSFIGKAFSMNSMFLTRITFVYALSIDKSECYVKCT